MLLTVVGAAETPGQSLGSALGIVAVLSEGDFNLQLQEPNKTCETGRQRNTLGNCRSHQHRRREGVDM